MYFEKKCKPVIYLIEHMFTYVYYMSHLCVKTDKLSTIKNCESGTYAAQSTLVLTFVIQ